MNEIGSFALILAMLVAAYTTAVSFWNLQGRRGDLQLSAENGTLAMLGLLTVASFALLYAFIIHDFSLEYVAHYSSRDLPGFYAASAFWAGQSGSLLLWAWLLALFATAVVLQNRQKNRALMPVVVGVLSGIGLFFLVLMVFLSNPFQSLPAPLPDGQGLNPMLQNPGMIFHPPTLYLGYVGFAVPFAFAIAALLTRQLDESWIKSTRRWTLFSWLALTLGNLFGAQWAYMELGWGGYWAWDPVENASLMPWLTGTAFLHSVMIQEKRGMLKVWNVALIVLTFALTIFGTFITRSGIISSVHSFGVSSLGPVFMLFLGTTVGFSIWLIASRRAMLRSRNQLDAFLSREASFLFNNLILVGIAFATLWGTVFPMVSEAVMGNKLTVGPPFFNEVNTPIGLALLVLTGICPLLAWRRSSARNFRRNFLIPGSIGLAVGAGFLIAGVTHIYALLTFSLAAFVLATIGVEFWSGIRVRRSTTGENPLRAFGGLVSRNRRRYGGYIVHIGVVLVFVGIAGSAFNQQVQTELKPGESATIGAYTLTYERPMMFQERNKSVIAADLAVVENGRPSGHLKPEKAFYPRHGQPVSEVAVRSGLLEDLYIVLENLGEDHSATLQFFVNPLVGWIWAGGWLMLAGTLVAIWPERRRRPSRMQLTPPRVSRKSKAAAIASLLLLLGTTGVQAAPTVRDVAAELACLCGCGMTAGNCTHKGCGSATGIKAEVGKLLKAGMGKDEILADFAARYGDQALAAPPKRGFSLTAWVLPFAVLLTGGFGLYGVLSRWATERAARPPTVAHPISSKYTERLARELSEFE